MVFRGFLAKSVFVILSFFLLVWNIALSIFIIRGTTQPRSQNDTASESYVFAALCCWIIPSVLAFVFMSSRWILAKKPGRRIVVSATLIVLPLIITSFGLLFENSLSCEIIRPGADLARCIYEGRDLSGVDLSSANLFQVNLHRSNLTGVNLSGANLVRANLTEVNLTDAILDGANLDGVSLYNTIGLTDNMLTSVSSWRGLALESHESMTERLGPICQRLSISEGSTALPITPPSGDFEPVIATEYIPDESFHPIVLLDISGETHALTHEMATEWWPAQARLTELLACIEDQEEIIESCRYGSEFVHRIVRTMNVNLIHANSGILVAEITLRGSEPQRSCPEAISAIGAIPTIYGESITVIQVMDALSQYVNPSGEIDRLTLSQ